MDELIINLRKDPLSVMEMSFFLKKKENTFAEAKNVTHGLLVSSSTIVVHT